MQLTKRYQLILFDFDGLLVNTEDIHYQSYLDMCAKRGFELKLTFHEFCQIAHYRSEGLKDEIYRKLPQLQKQEPDWNVLYQEKKFAFLELVDAGKVELMKGAEKLLEKLDRDGVKRCVVTHSSKTLVDSIRKRHPILNTIPYWITREDYERPKPEPECYIKAIQRYAKEDENVLGLEDTPRGLTALMKTKAKPVIVAQFDYPELPSFIEKGVTKLRSLDELL